MILTTYELVDRISNLKSDTERLKRRFFMKKFASNQIFFKNKTHRRQDLSNKMRRSQVF